MDTSRALISSGRRCQMTKRKRPVGSRRERRTFSDQFKREAMRLVEERRARGVSLEQIGRELDIHPNLLRLWARQQAAAGSAPAAPETPEQELRRLRREVERLRQERDFAKKAAAFFMKESR